jgi:hypothetical protein
MKWNHITSSGRSYPLGEAAAALHTATVGGNLLAWVSVVARLDGNQHSLARASGAVDGDARASMDSETHSRTAGALAAAAAAGGRSCTAQPRKWGLAAAVGRSHSRTRMAPVGMVRARTSAVAEVLACTDAVGESPAYTAAEGHGARRRGGGSRWRRARR